MDCSRRLNSGEQQEKYRPPNAMLLFQSLTAYLSSQRLLQTGEPLEKLMVLFLQIQTCRLWHQHLHLMLFGFQLGADN